MLTFLSSLNCKNSLLLSKCLLASLVRDTLRRIYYKKPSPRYVLITFVVLKVCFRDIQQEGPELWETY